MGAKLGVLLINMYQKCTRHMPHVCRYIPSCSEYMKQAIQKYGFLRGGWLGFKRICRCHPWGSDGHDPVP